MFAMLGSSFTRKVSHLFIPSGQSSMADLDSGLSYIPAVSQKFGAGNVIVVEYALGGQPIRR